MKKHCVFSLIAGGVLFAQASAVSANVPLEAPNPIPHVVAWLNEMQYPIEMLHTQSPILEEKMERYRNRWTFLNSQELKEEVAKLKAEIAIEDREFATAFHLGQTLDQLNCLMHVREWVREELEAIPGYKGSARARNDSEAFSRSEGVLLERLQGIQRDLKSSHPKIAKETLRFQKAWKSGREKRLADSFRALMDSVDDKNRPFLLGLVLGGGINKSWYLKQIMELSGVLEINNSRQKTSTLCYSAFGEASEMYGRIACLN